MSSTTRLLVLGVVKLFQPVHGYVVRRELLSWRAQDWASVQPGSIYNALKTLTRDGFLEIASTDQVGGRPERTTYRLTRAGSDEFSTLLREEWWNVRMPVDPLMTAISFLGEVARDEAIAALEHRAAQIHGMVRHTEFAIASFDSAESPDHVREMMRLANARLGSELAWSQQFIERLRGGEYTTAGDPPWQPRSAQAGRPEPGDGAGAPPSAGGSNGHRPAREPPARAAGGRSGDLRPGRPPRTTPGRGNGDPRPPRTARGRGDGDPRPGRANRTAARRGDGDPRPAVPRRARARGRVADPAAIDRDHSPGSGAPPQRADRRRTAWTRGGRRSRPR